MDKTRKKTIVLSVAMAAMMLLPQTVSAQYDESKYGLQPWFGSSMMGRDGSNGGYNVSTEQFGSNTNGGYQIGTEQFGNNLPLGSGLFIMAAAGAAYALKKRKMNK